MPVLGETEGQNRCEVFCARQFVRGIENGPSSTRAVETTGAVAVMTMARSLSTAGGEKEGGPGKRIDCNPP